MTEFFEGAVFFSSTTEISDRTAFRPTKAGRFLNMTAAWSRPVQFSLALFRTGKSSGLAKFAFWTDRAASIVSRFRTIKTNIQTCGGLICKKKIWRNGSAFAVAWRSWGVKKRSEKVVTRITLSYRQRVNLLAGAFGSNYSNSIPLCLWSILSSPRVRFVSSESCGANTVMVSDLVDHTVLQYTKDYVAYKRAESLVGHIWLQWHL